VGAVRVVLPGSAVGLYFVPIVLAVSLLLLLLLLLFQLSLFFIFSVYDPFVQSWCILWRVFSLFLLLVLVVMVRRLMAVENIAFCL
jgi:hypothetical protein